MTTAKPHRTPAFIGAKGEHHPFVCRVCDEPAECDGDCDGVQPYDDAHVHYGYCSDAFAALPAPPTPQPVMPARNEATR